MLVALVLAVLGWAIYVGRPREGMAEEAAAYDTRLAANPATAPGEAAVGDALRDLLAVTAAPDLILQTQEQWREDRVPDGVADRNWVVSAPDRAAALRNQAKFWRDAVARRPAADELAQACVYQVPYAPCTVGASGDIPGSAGALRYQEARRFIAAPDGPDADARFKDAEAAARSDPMVGSTIDIFAADPAGGWRMVLALSGQPSSHPAQIESPGGPLLSVPTSDRSGPLLYAMVEGRWRYLYQAAWMQALATRAPAGTCLDGGFYLGQWPWPKQLIPELTRLRLDPATFTVDTAYFADGAKAALVHATVGLQADELVLLSADVRVTKPASLWARMFDRCHGSP